MRNLEKEMGIELMIRSHKGIVLTEKGKEFFLGANEIVERWEVLQANLKDEWLSGELQVSIAPLLEDDYYVKLLEYIEKHHLPVQLEVINLQANDAAIALKNNQIDLAALCLLRSKMDELLLKYPMLEFVLKKQIRVTVLLGKQSALAKKATICVNDLKEQCCIVEKNMKQEMDMYREFLGENSTSKIVEVNSFYAKQKMVAGNLGFALNIENGPILRNYENEMVNILLEDAETLVSGILFNKKMPKEKLLKEILNAW